MSEFAPEPILEVARGPDGTTIMPRGRWNVQGLSAGTGGRLARRRIQSLEADLLQHAGAAGVTWDLTHAGALDHVGAMMFWQAWGGRQPANLRLHPQHRMLFDNFAAMQPAQVEATPFDPLGVFVGIGREMLRFGEHLSGFVRLLGQITLDVARFAARPQAGPWREISANLYRSGAQALGITALVGFLIGIVLSYLSAKQLKQFGAGRLHRRPAGCGDHPRTRAGAGGHPGGRAFRLGDDSLAGRHARHRGTRRAHRDGHPARLPVDHAQGGGAGDRIATADPVDRRGCRSWAAWWPPSCNLIFR